MREWWRRQFGPNLPRWVAFWVWVAMTAGVLGRVIAVPPERGSVVPIYLAGGERWLAGDPLYQIVPGLDIYRNPPGIAVLFAPLALLEAKTAAILWRLASLAVYGYGIHRLLTDVLPPLGRWRRCGVWVAAAVLMIPAVNNGQINLLVTATAVCGACAAARGRWWEAAAWLAGCGYFKLYTFAIGLLVCVRFPRSLSWRFALMTAAVFAVPFVCQHPGYVLDRHAEFIEVLQSDDRSAASHARAPRDWTVIAREVVGEPVPRVIALAMSLVAAVEFTVTVWVSRRPSPAVVLVPMCLGLLWITLFGPSTEVNTYCVLAPVVGFLTSGVPTLDRWSRWLSWVGTGGLLAVEIRAAFGGGTEFDLSWLQPLGAAALTWAVIRWARGEPRVPTRG